MVEHERPPDDNDRVLSDQIVAAAQRAVREALRDHKQAGNPIAVWRDGQVVWIPPEEIKVPDEDPPA